MKLSSKTILITGGTSGIGLELARQLLLRGNTVIATGRDRARLDAVSRSLPDLHVFESDVSDAGAIELLCRDVVAQFPALDVLINNAGIMRTLDVQQDRDLQDVTKEIDVNLSGTVRMVQQFLPHLRTRSRSLIVNVSSGLAFVPLPIAPIYCAAKAGIHSYTRSLREQLKDTGVDVVELAPPAVKTPLADAFADQMKGQTVMDVTVLARHAIAGIEAGKIEIRPGQSNLLKAMSRIAPNFIFKQMAKLGTPTKRTSAVV